ncbi:MAG: alkyl hydroperoxide reductase subunit F [Desulfobulbus propionicus]|nr:MAG: alkyl hydroperoxide reductase subunit F [Desulfobulbus propionicus]
MLDSQIVEQLATVFEKLQGAVELVYAQSSHEKQAELVEMLEQVAATSSHVASRQSDKSSATPFFEIFHNSEKTGIAFSGIPGGHEFTSLILAVLNADRQGKLPDEGIIRRVQNLQGPINLRTFVSLSCENCPEVVQSLNVMTVLHSDFTHEMVDGAFFQDEIEALGIQGVPSVVDGEDLISSGKTDFAELLTTLEEHFGIDSEAKTEPVDLGTFDVAVVGGGPAGSSAAIYAARKGLQTVLVAEKIGGQVKETKGIENLISVPYTEGPELAGKLAQHLAEYDIKTLEHRRLDTIALGDMKQLELNSGEFLQAKSVIVATGAKWRTLNIPGEKEYIGRGVAFCPHCDGPFYKGRDIAVIGGGNSGIEAAIDLAGMVKSVAVFEFLPELKADNVLVEKLKTMGNVTIFTNAQTTEVVGNGEKVTGLKYKDRETNEEHLYPLDGIFVQIGLLPNSTFVKDIVETNQMGEIVIDEKCRTSQKGIYAAGDVTTVPYKQIIISMGEGAKAALTTFEDQVLSQG